MNGIVGLLKASSEEIEWQRDYGGSADAFQTIRLGSRAGNRAAE
jgi:hypothetical protein